MISVRIPYAFIDERVDLSWSEVLFGLEQQLTDSEPAIAIATEQVSREEQVPYQKIQVAALSKGDPVIDLVSEIVEYEPCASAEEIKAKWLYLVRVHFKFPPEWQEEAV